MLNKTFSNLIDSVRLLFRKEKESYLCFYRMLGFYPHDIHVYEQALLHKSSSVKSDQGRLMNNERLEFLGDAILDAVVGDLVYRKFEGKREGFLTNTRSKIVSRESLNFLAEQIGLTKLVKFTTRHSSHNSYMGGNAFEALVATLAVKNDIVPPTINHEEGDNDENIDYNLNFTFGKAQKREVRAALSNTFGFGGHNACVILKKYAE